LGKPIKAEVGVMPPPHDQSPRDSLVALVDADTKLPQSTYVV